MQQDNKANKDFKALRNNYIFTVYFIIKKDFMIVAKAFFFLWYFNSTCTVLFLYLLLQYLLAKFCIKKKQHI